MSVLSFEKGLSENKGSYCSFLFVLHHMLLFSCALLRKEIYLYSFDKGDDDTNLVF